MELSDDSRKLDGYKFPKDWVLKRLGEFGRFYKGRGILKNEVLPFGNPCIRYGELYTKHNDYIKSIDSFISPETANRSVRVSKGDILFAGSGETKEDIGKCAAFLGSEETYIGGDVIAFSPANTDSLFLGFMLNHRFINSQKAQLGQGDAVVHIYPAGLANILVPLPPTLAEQKAIATALSDMDALISSLEKLIEKKRAIKQGMMQLLLKPKEGWEVKTLKEVVRYRRGSFPQPYGLEKWYDDDSGYPFVQVFDVDENFKLKKETKRKISEAAQAMSVFIEKGSIVITLQGSIGRIAITQYDAYVDRTLLVFESFLVPFNKYFFAMSIFLLFDKEKQNAPGGIIKTITKEALSSFTISFPKIEDQEKIANTLEDMESEIEAQEYILLKYKMLKQGMMQELLTGKTRLI